MYTRCTKALYQCSDPTSTASVVSHRREARVNKKEARAAALPCSESLNWNHHSGDSKYFRLLNRPAGMCDV